MRLVITLSVRVSAVIGCTAMLASCGQSHLDPADRCADEAPAGNLVPNSDFATALSGWNGEGHDSPDHQWVAEDATGCHASGALQALGSRPATNGNEPAVVSDCFTVAAGTTYSAAMWIRQGTPNATPGTTADDDHASRPCSILFFSAKPTPPPYGDGVSICTSPLDSPETLFTAAAAGGWHQAHLTVVAPAQAAYARVYCSFNTYPAAIDKVFVAPQ